jgi:diguanylate cyclase (GGDEF)-like protein/PAS domain S-box-containing protein
LTVPRSLASVMSDRRLPYAVFAAGLAATAVFLLSPSASPVQLAASTVPFALALAMLGARVVVSPPGVRRPLQMLLGGTVLYVGAWAVWYVGPVAFDAVLPFPSPLDAVFFLAYTCYAGFLLLALRRRALDGGLQSRLALADTSIFTLAAAAPLWVAVVQPNLINGTPALPSLVAVAYPAAMLFLFALATRLTFSCTPGQRRVGTLLFGWIGAELVADALYGVQSANGTFGYDRALIATWLVGYTSLATLAAHPRLVAFLQPDGADAATGIRARSAAQVQLLRRLRGALLLLAALVPLTLAAFTRGQDLALMLLGGVIFALALYRASLLAGDLSEQRRLSLELQAAVSQLQAQQDDLVQLAAALHATSDAVVTCSPAGSVLRWNLAAEQLFGYPADEALGWHINHFVLPEQRQVQDATREAVLHDGQAGTDRVVVRKDGSTVEVEMTLSAIRNGEGPVTGIVGICRDVTARRQLQREVAEHAARLDEAQQIAGVGSWDWDLATDEVEWSDEMRRIFGLDRDAAVSLEVFLDHIHAADRERVEQEIRRPDAELAYEARIVGAGGEVRWIFVRTTLVTGRGGEPLRSRGIVQDVTERSRLQQELAAHVARLDEAQRLAGVGSYVWDIETGEERWSAEQYRIFGVDQTVEPSYEVFLERVHPDDRAKVEQLVQASLDDETVTYETRILRPDAELRWVALRGEVERDAKGIPVRKIGTVLDITERKAAQAELERLALTDTLTGLANRERFGALLSDALEPGPARRTVALLLLDLDGFKDVNDGLGHDAGDLVLREVARRVTTALRGDQLARLGGDEFALVLPDVAGLEDAIAVAGRILSALEPAFDLHAMTVHVGASIGIVLGHDGDDAGTLLKHADVAMYRAKTLASGWAVFDADQDDVAAGRLQMVADLRSAIESGELEVAYQPILHGRSRRVTSFEALARWHHPERGAIHPDQFIPLAEQADLIIPLTRLVLRRAAAACAAWRAAGHDLRVGVNLAVQAMQSGDACAMVAEELAAAGLDPQHLVLEITESSLATEGEGVADVLRALRELGVTLVIDDFGTGYSAMSYLKELPVEELKIDRSFVRDIATDPRDLAIVRSLIRLAHSLSLRVVAEGVESAAALEVLNGLGCDFAQGYGIARAMPQAETAEWLARHDTGLRPGAAPAAPNDLLVVDDSRAVRAQLRELATAQGWRVREAASAEEALTEVERCVPDVVILDHYMTGMTGMQAVPQLRAVGLDGPILLFTQFLSEALPSLRVPLDVWPVSKKNPGAVLELLGGYRASMSELVAGPGASPGVPMQALDEASGSRAASTR